MNDRPKECGIYAVHQHGQLIGSFEVTHNSASGLMCKELRLGGSMQCPGFSDWNRYSGTTWTKLS
jgi:hypothetical protein